MGTREEFRGFLLSFLQCDSLIPQANKGTALAMSPNHLADIQISHGGKSWLELQLICLGKMPCDPFKPEGEKLSSTHFPVSLGRLSEEVQDFVPQPSYRWSYTI